MPELPEVEVVRRGLADHAVGTRIGSAKFSGLRVARDHPGGAAGLAAEIEGQTLLSAERRGKFLWLPLSGGAALTVHLRMSGQLLVTDPDAPIRPHTHARLRLTSGRELRFVDQRTFGSMTTSALVPDPHAPAGAATRMVPTSMTHIAPDPFEAAFDPLQTARRIRGRDVEIKRQLLDQGIVSGIGNIYADEALWAAKVHGETAASSMSKTRIRAVIDVAREIMAAALAQGGTSFDSLYVDVSGSSGYFARSLNVYGLAGQPCPRCGTPIVRKQFMKRSSHYCPICQRRR